MALMAAPGLSVAAAGRLIASAIDLVAHLARRPDGGRCVERIAEVRIGDEGPVLRTFVPDGS